MDVFAGCGGLSLGLKRAGWKGLFAIEKNESAFETLAANFPTGTGPLNYRWPVSIEHKPWDIRELLVSKSRELRALAGTIDLLAGGPPCQGFSHAGRRRSDDPRNKLFEAYLELVEVLKPKMVLVENVRGFTTDFPDTPEGETKNFALALKWRLGVDYDLVSEVIKASDFGVPQARPRFFLIGVRKDLRLSTKIATLFHLLRDECPSYLAARKLPRHPTARDALSDLEVQVNGVLPSTETPGFFQTDYAGPRTSFQHGMRDGHSGAPSDLRLARHSPEIKNRFSAIIRACIEEGRLNVAISPETRKVHGLKKIAIRVLDPLRPAPTITSLPEDLLHYSEPRPLTVRENARLQTFPDWFVFKGKYTTGGQRRRTEVPRFTQVANAVPPLLAEQLGRVLSKLLFTHDNLDADGVADGVESRPLSSQLGSEVNHPLFVDRHAGLTLLNRP